LRNSVLNVLARTVSGQTALGFKYLDWIARQAIVDTADAENLDNWGRVYGVPRKGTEKASGSVVFSGVDGSVVNVGTQIQRADGVLYTTTASGTIATGSATVAAIADDGGTSGNASASASLSLVEPASGINSTASVATGGFVGGADAEDDESYRARILARIQQPPHGGSRSDYEQWALAVSGVTRAWVYPNELGLGTVTVRFVKDGNTTPVPQNLLLYSEDFSNAAWAKSNVTVTAGGAIHPETSDVYTLTPAAADSTVRQQVTIWEAGAFQFNLDVYGLGGSRTFDLKIFAADGTTQLATASVNAPSGAWATVTVTGTASVATSIWVQIGGASSFSTGETIAATRAHVRQTATASAYIKTAADSIVGSLLIPTKADVEDVLAYIDDPSRAPVTADVVVVSPIAKRLDITVTNLSPNTSAVQAAVLAELQDLFARDAEPGGPNGEGTIYVSRIWEAVSIASGEFSHTITSPAADQTQTIGRMWVLGKVTFA
jgi:uncharacterized phage protein gp47/JayE